MHRVQGTNLIKMRYEIKLSTILAVLIVGTIVIKLLLISNGMFALPDESRYSATIDALIELKNLHLKGFLFELFSNNARPVEAFVKIIPAILQKISSSLFHNDFHDPMNTHHIFIFNYVIHIFIIVIHYRLSKILVKDQSLTLLSVLIFSSLTNSYIYLRHCLPYDSSLLLLYFVLYKFIKHYNLEQITNKRLFNWGVIVAIAYLIYPGYLLFIASFSILLLIMLYFDSGLIKSIKLYLNYILSVCFVMLITEVLSRIGGISYFREFIDYMETVTLVYSGENFIFIFKYLIQVEGLNGWILILGLAAYIMTLIYNRQESDFKSISVNTFFCFSAILVLATVVYSYNKISFYGRVRYYFHLCHYFFFNTPAKLSKLCISKRHLLFICKTGCQS
jgi:hypothetical protein